MSKRNPVYTKQRDLEDSIPVVSRQAPIEKQILELENYIRDLQFKLSRLTQLVFHVDTEPTDGNLDISYSNVLVDTDNVATLTLPYAVIAKRHIFRIKYAAGSSNMTINPQSGETIDGASSLVVTNLYDAPMLTSDGTNWYIL